jgi:hypothetical protein
MPDGTMFGEDGRTIWVTFAYTGDQTAFFQKGYCGVMPTAMHELDQLMGFGHSNEGDSICQDKLGVLGSSIVMIGGPNYCLNGHKPGRSSVGKSLSGAVRLDGREEEGGEHALTRRST